MTTFSSLYSRFVTAAAILALVLAAMPTASASAAEEGSVVVNFTDDVVLNDANCSLREAIAAANNNSSFNGCVYTGTGPDDVITLTSGLTYTLSLVGSTDMTGDLDVGNAGGTSGNLTIKASGSSNAIIDANDVNRVIEVDSPGNFSLTLIHITVTDGSAPDGAGIYFGGSGTLTLTNSTVSDNTATGSANCGAGIYDNSAATVIITDSTISGNTCPSSGSDGAGLFKGNGGTLTITKSLFYNNSAMDNGGGMRLDLASGTASITNSTFANNSAGNRGGGLQATSGTVTVSYSTFSGNSSNSAGGGGAIQSDGGAVTVERSILANSIVNGVTGVDCDQFAPGTVNAATSLVELNNDCTGQIASSTDPKLGALGNNGGPTQTLALLPGSPAINLTNDGNCPATDQRGMPRPEGAHCDLGAYEYDYATVDVTIADAPAGSYDVGTLSTVNDDYFNIVDGPVKVVSTTGEEVIPSQRAVYGSSFNEVMGYPANKFATEYWFPWYDDLYMKTWILVGNPSNTQTAYVDIYIGGVKRNSSPYAIAAGDRVTPRFSGVVDGPVQVVSVSGTGTPTPIDIFASERSIYGNSFNEVMGYPAEQFTTEYWFPWYDNVSQNAWVLVGNPNGSQNAYVDIYIGGVKRNLTPYTIAPNDNITPRFQGLIDGPVQVVSVSGTGTPSPIDIFASERVLYAGSFNEVMGYPDDQLTSEYWFPWYDNVGMATWVLVGNPSTTETAYVDIYIGGQKYQDQFGQVQTYAIAPGNRVTPRFPGVTTGPVQVVSVTGDGTPSPVDIFTSERVVYASSFNEVMGYPDNQLTTEYWFTWYDNLYMSSHIFIAKP